MEEDYAEIRSTIGTGGTHSTSAQSPTLWVLTWGRKEQPKALQARSIREQFRSTIALSTMAAGAGISLSLFPMKASRSTANGGVG